MGALSDWLSGVVGIADEYVRTGITVSVKTNYGPEVPVFSGEVNGGSNSGGGRGSSGLSVGKLLGFKAAVIVRDRSGRTLATYGDPPPTDPVRVAVALAVVAGIGFLLLRGVLK